MADDLDPRSRLTESLLAAVIAADTAEYQPEGGDSDENWWRYIIAKAVVPTVIHWLPPVGPTFPEWYKLKKIEERRTLTAERDGLQARLNAGLALHTEFKIYEECGHEHTDDDVDAGRAFAVEEVGYVCADGYLYSICKRCCTDDTGIQGEACANHERPCWPCATVAALQGDQPAEPKLRHVVGYDTSGELGDCLDDCPACEAEDAEPAVTPPDPSGRIVGSGPVQPFMPEDHHG